MKPALPSPETDSDSDKKPQETNTVIGVMPQVSALLSFGTPINTFSLFSHLPFSPTPSSLTNANSQHVPMGIVAEQPLPAAPELLQASSSSQEYKSQDQSSLSKDTDESVIFSEAPFPQFDNNVFLDAMLVLVLEYFKDGYISPYLLFKDHFTYLKSKRSGHASLLSWEGFLTEEVNSIINDEMNLYDANGHKSTLLKKLFSVNFSFNLDNTKVALFKDIFQEQKDDAEINTPTPKQNLTANDDNVEMSMIPIPSLTKQELPSTVKESEDYISEIIKIIALLDNKQFDEATYRAKKYFDTYRKDRNKIFDIKINGSNKNAIVLFYEAYTALAIELFETRGHLTMALYALSGLWKYTSFSDLQSIRKDLIKIGKKLHSHLMEIIKHKGADFYNKIKEKLESSFAKKNLHPKFYQVLNNIFTYDTFKGVFSFSAAFLSNPKRKIPSTSSNESQHSHLTQRVQINSFET